MMFEHGIGDFASSQELRHGVANEFVDAQYALQGLGPVLVMGSGHGIDRAFPRVSSHLARSPRSSARSAAALRGSSVAMVLF